MLCVRLRSPCDPECGSGEGKWTDMISPFSNMSGSESNETSEGASVCVRVLFLCPVSQNSFLFKLLHLLHIFSRVMTIIPSYLEGFESWFDRAAACMRQTPRKLHRFASKISKNKIKFNLVFSISCKKKNKPQNFSLVPARTDVLLHLPLCDITGRKFPKLCCFFLSHTIVTS